MGFIPTPSTGYDQWVFPETPYTSTIWTSGSAAITSSNTGVIDLSASFGMPANLKAIWAHITGVGGGIGQLMRLSPTSSDPNGVFIRTKSASFLTVDVSGIVTCDGNGDVYATIDSGSTFNPLYLWIWGYVL